MWEPDGSVQPSLPPCGGEGRSQALEQDLLLSPGGSRSPLPGPGSRGVGGGQGRESARSRPGWAPSRSVTSSRSVHAGAHVRIPLLVKAPFCGWTTFCWSCSRSPDSPYEFEMTFSISAKKKRNCHQDFDRDRTESVVQFESYRRLCSREAFSSVNTGHVPFACVVFHVLKQHFPVFIVALFHLLS